MKRPPKTAERAFVIKATASARRALKKGDCRQAEHWLRQIATRTTWMPPARLLKSLNRCYRR